MLDNHRRHVAELNEIAEPLEGLQQDEESKVGYLAASDSVGKCGLFSGRRVHGREFVGGRVALQSRISGLVSTRHISPPTIVYDGVLARPETKV